MSHTPADTALNDARRFAAKGEHAAALERHLWYHDHALESAPSHYGVRLSFALADWRRLGEAYPPARDALLRVRDQKTERLVAGLRDREQFHDVVAINRCLKDGPATVTLFKIIESASPVFASELYPIMIEDLVENREYALAKKYLGDAHKRLAEAKDTLDEGLEFERTHGHADTLRACERLFAADVIRIITVLRETDDRPLARDIQTRALSLLDDVGIRAAFADQPGSGRHAAP